MAISLKLILSLIGLTLGATALVAPHPDPPNARLALEWDGGQLAITGLYDGPATSDELSYQLKVTRTGPAGTSNSSQSGSFRSTAGTDTLSTVQINVAHGDGLEMRLSIRTEEGGEIAVVEHREVID